MSAHKLPRQCSKCPATASPAAALAAGWNRDHHRGRPSTWTCATCYKPPVVRQRSRPEVRCEPLRPADDGSPSPARLPASAQSDDAWTAVTSGVLVRVETYDGPAYALNIAGRGCWLGGPGTRPRNTIWVPFSAAASWEWGISRPRWAGRMTVIAQGLTGKEEAKTLQQLAEVSEIREDLMNPGEIKVPDGLARVLERMVEDGDENGALDLLARRLHEVGWRRGMTRHDAARRLSATAYPGQICAAGHPLEQDAHAPSDIPCAHFPERPRPSDLRGRARVRASTWALLALLAAAPIDPRE